MAQTSSDNLRTARRSNNGDPVVVGSPRVDPTRVPPSDLVAEESLLGAMLLNRDAVTAVTGIVHGDDFYKPSHAHIFESIMALIADNQPADPVTVADSLRRADLLEAIGGASQLVALQANTPAIASAERYARIVADLAALRRLIGVAGEIAEMSYSMPEDIAATIDHAESLVFKIGERRSSQSVAALSDALKATLDRLEMLYDRKESITGVPTGYNDLDELLSGLQPETLVVVGARPAMGKTAFALGMARNAAIEGNKAVLFCSLEMGTLELTQRLLAAEARVDAERMRTGRLAEADWSRINHAIGRLATAPIFLDDNPMLTVMELRAKARRLSSKLPNGLGLIIVDYLQLMSARRQSESRALEVGEMSRGLKILARELKVPVVALSQLSRNLENRVDKRPMLSDLRESGCLAPETLITRADTGEQVTIGQLAASGARDVPVWSVDEHGQVVEATLTRAFSSGVKDTFALRLSSGRVVQASANHPFLTVEGWRALGDLVPGEQVAVPAVLPDPVATGDLEVLRDSEVVLLAHLIATSGTSGCSITAEGLARCTSLQYVSDDAECLAVVEDAVRAFGVYPRRVWADGRWALTIAPVTELHSTSTHPIVGWLRDLGIDPMSSTSCNTLPALVSAMGRRQVALFLHHFVLAGAAVFSGDVLAAHASRSLVAELQQLYVRTGIATRLVEVHGTTGLTMWSLLSSGSIDLRECEGQESLFVVETVSASAVMAAQAGVDQTFNGETSTVVVLAQPASSHPVEAGYRSDDVRNSDMLAWDTVVAIEPLGPFEVFDATVEPTHNFLANGVVVHNSIEQDADVVMFLYRDEIYNPESSDKGMAEVLVSKHRNGPTGMARLAFLNHHTTFANMAK
jgi:replicative DNA helicase